MNNKEGDVTEKLLVLKQLLENYTKAAKAASDKIISENISNYPIFVVHQDQVEIGVPLFTAEQTKSQWAINASTLEEFYTKGLISKEKLDDFRKLYKNHPDDICFFVLSELGAQYLFIPVKDY
ncbi:MAG TPA: hypothetical protein ENK91_12720 [Bacteroidetes bacterium]|nr:hypothetical protein [Bacteroidota bacterium]